jgi:hypothetical protein
MAEPPFDVYVMVDWSAASARGREGGQADGLWAAVGEEGHEDRVRPFRTRGELVDWLVDLLGRLVAEGRRVLCGVDVAFGYPAGTAVALGAPADASPWRWTWELLAAEVSDGPDNRNDRFEAAGRLNARMGAKAGPFWGLPPSHDVADLAPRKPHFPVTSASGVTLEEWRAVERYHRGRGAAPKSVWQVSYAGAVGGQTLTALPALHRIVTASPVAERCVVWPFETGLRAPATAAGSVLFAEVYPSLTQADGHRHDVRDARQVLALVDGCRRMAAQGAMGTALGGPSLTRSMRHAVLSEEGWILHVAPASAAATVASGGIRGSLRPAADAAVHTRAIEQRRAAWSTVERRLTALDDAELLGVVAAAAEHGTGIGGVTSVVDVGGVSVFTKVVPLTGCEQEPGNVRSTRNVFRLPAFCQYGVVGSPGFTAWRELEAHQRTTQWVLDGETADFPLLYHWRVLPVAIPDPVDEHGDRDTAVAFWHGAPGVADRLAALDTCNAGLVLFMERLPHQLDDWLRRQLAVGGAHAAAAIEQTAATLLEPMVELNRRGLFHFDAHLGNLLTDGTRVLVTDFGLATASDFDLDEQERDFLARHQLHDPAYTITKFVNRLVTDLVGLESPAARNAYIADHATTHRPLELPAAADAVLRRYAPVAQVINAFYWRLFTEARDLPFPTAPLQRAATAAALPGLEP